MMSTQGISQVQSCPSEASRFGRGLARGVKWLVPATCPVEDKATQCNTLAMKRVITSSRQSIDASDIDAVVATLNSDFLTTGPAIERFETAVCEYTGAGYAVAVANASAALHLACRAMGLKAGETLWTSPNTFVASANCADHCGARADFVDIDAKTLNLSVEKLEQKLKATPTHLLPKIVIPVHFAGRTCDLTAIHRLAEQFSFRVIEDAAHAIGSTHRGEKIGNCRFSDMTVFSFHPVKNITSGEGGMITTNDPELAQKLRELRSLGITRVPERMQAQPNPGPWYYEQIDLGYNYRMTDIEAALGLSQLRRLDAFVEKRQRIFDFYDAALANLPLIRPTPAKGDRIAWHLYVIQIDESRAPLDRRALFMALRDRGILVNVHYIPVYLQPLYRE